MEGSRGVGSQRAAPFGPIPTLASLLFHFGELQKMLSVLFHFDEFHFDDCNHHFIVIVVVVVVAITITVVVSSKCWFFFHKCNLKGPRVAPEGWADRLWPSFFDQLWPTFVFRLFAFFPKKNRKTR